MNTKTSLITALALALLIPAAAHADTAKFDAAMQPLLTPYFKIHAALAGDTDKGVAKAAKKIARLAGKVNPKSVDGMHAAHYKALPGKIKAAASTLAKAKGIAAQREAFKDLSKPLAMWVSMSKPAGVNVVFCSMAKGSWLQKDKTIANPFYGAKMLRCGEIIGGKDKGEAGGHMKKGDPHKGHKH